MSGSDDGAAPCCHGESPKDRRAVTECFGSGDGDTMICRCHLCGAVRTYRVLDYAGPTIEYGPWQAVVEGTN